jgi:hypothetical protein
MLVEQLGRLARPRGFQIGYGHPILNCEERSHEGVNPGREGLTIWRGIGSQFDVSEGQLVGPREVLGVPINRLS